MRERLFFKTGQKQQPLTHKRQNLASGSGTGLSLREFIEATDKQKTLFRLLMPAPCSRLRVAVKVGSVEDAPLKVAIYADAVQIQELELIAGVHSLDYDQGIPAGVVITAVVSSGSASNIDIMFLGLVQWVR